MNIVEKYPNQRYGWAKENDGSWSLYAPDGTKVIGTVGDKVQVPTPVGTTDATTKSYVDAAVGGGGGSTPFNGGTITDALDIEVAAPTLPITGVNTGTSTFTVAGEQTALFGVGDEFYVVGSTGNDREYTVASATFASDHTDIVVEAPGIVDPTVDGEIRPDIAPLLTIAQPDNPTGAFGLSITNAETGAQIYTNLDGLGAASEALLRLVGGDGVARFALEDGVEDGLISFSTERGIYWQPRSDSADGDVFVEIADKNGNDTLVVEADGKLGFFGHAPAAQQTGVAVDAAAIHAALVALGLITA